MKFKILKTFKASLDGFNLANFNNDEILEENDNRLTKHFLAWASDNKGFIEEIKEEKMLPQFENKAIFSASQNKEVEVELVLETEIVEEQSKNKEEIKINNKRKVKNNG